jgi:hypothetical protein
MSLGFRPLTNAERADLRSRTARALCLLGHFSGFPVEVRQPCERCGCLLWARVEGGRWPGECARCLHCMPPLEMFQRHPEMMQIVEESLHDERP